MRLRGEVDDGVAAVPRRGDRLGIADVALDELELRALEVRRIPRVGELVQHDHLVAGRGQPLREVRADEARAAGHQDSHRAEA